MHRLLPAKLDDREVSSITAVKRSLLLENTLCATADSGIEKVSVDMIYFPFFYEHLRI